MSESLTTPQTVKNGFYFEDGADKLWTMTMNGHTVQMIFDRIDLNGDWVSPNIASAVLFNGRSVSFACPSQHTPQSICNEENIGTLSVFQDYLRFHANMVVLGAVDVSDEFRELFVSIVKMVCGYHYVQEGVMHPIPFQDGAWVRVEGNNYFMHLTRMIRNGRYYTARIRQTEHPGRLSMPHQIPGQIDMIRTFYLASSVSDEAEGKPVVDHKDGDWPKPFTLLV